jgi:hydroxymethylpyrimidine pyrophosphatase-like HAD family hydrolase
MQIRALAFDYDGTLAVEGALSEATRDALARLKASGRKLLMVTGRELPDLLSVCDEIAVFDAIVAENGALLHWPALNETHALAPPPPPEFVLALRARGVSPISVGSSIVATSRTCAASVRDVIAALGLEWAPIFNKNSLMCLPAGVSKASGFKTALEALGIASDEVLGAGDAENDRAFLSLCGVSVAVADALPELKASVDIVAELPAGEAIAWIADLLLNGGPDALARRMRPRPEPDVGDPALAAAERATTVSAGPPGATSL